MLRAMVVGLALLATSSIVSVAQTQLNAAEIRRDSGLLAICTNAEPDERSVAAALCTGYLQGVVEGVNFATLGDHDKLLICRPSDVTAEQMREVVVKYLKNHHNEVTSCLSYIPQKRLSRRGRASPAQLQDKRR